MEIGEFQRIIKDLYYFRDKKRGVEKTLLWLVEEVGELAEAIRKNKNVGEEIADIIAWTVSIANLYDIDVERELIKKYPAYCLKCGKSPCECKED